ncbi:MAG TPA: TlpA disulfide reductase family protein [Pyrinomonadaceae bacterium]|nr:TlpA disulfide reductase family protein [Pyrinomonadaceae bacterium]
MKQIFAAVLILCFAVTGFAKFGGDETAPLQQKEFEYKDWTLKNLRDNSEVNLRSFAKDKKLVLVVYFAAWCPNWHREMPLVKKLSEKYKDKGFEVIAVSEYASLEETKKHAADNKLNFPIVVESEKYEDREKTPHYKYRQAVGDQRKWGSPWNLFLETKELNKNGDVLGKKFSVVTGEMIEAEVEAFIREKLGLPKETKPAGQTVADKN